MATLPYSIENKLLRLCNCFLLAAHKMQRTQIPFSIGEWFDMPDIRTRYGSHFGSLASAYIYRTHENAFAPIFIDKHNNFEQKTVATQTATPQAKAAAAATNNNNSNNVFSVVSPAYWRFMTDEINASKDGSVGVAMAFHFIPIKLHWKSNSNQNMKMGFCVHARLGVSVCFLSPHFSENQNLLCISSKCCWAVFLGFVMADALCTETIHRL